MSYPYIERGGWKISLIEPFTIDNKLITEFEIKQVTPLSWNSNEVTLFRAQLNYNEWVGFQYDYSLSTLTRIMNDELRSRYEYYSWAQHANHAVMSECYHMLRPRYTGDDLFNHLLGDIRKQCNSLQSRLNTTAISPSTRIRSCIEDCRRQCRELDLGNIVLDEPYSIRFEPTNYITRSDTSAWNNYAYYPMYGSSLVNTANRVIVTTAGDTVSRGTRASSIDIDEDCRTLSDLWRTDLLRRADSNRQKSNIIHSFSYKPTYKKHYLNGENETTTLLLGAEIEVDNGGETEEHAKEVLKIMNGEDTWESEENIYCVHDGSLSKGLEFPTQPGSLAWHKTLPYKKMFKYLDEHGYKAHDTQTCGLHVHINRSFFGEHEAECIGKLMYILEKFNDEFSVIGRRNCRYAKMFGYNGEKCKELYQKGYSVKDKYNAINLMHEDTIEIRSFKGTLKYSTYINTLEFVEKLAHFVKSHTEEEIEEMKWSDLYETFSKDLKKYYDERAEIEKQKKQEEPLKKTSAYGNISIDSVHSVRMTDINGHVFTLSNDNISNVTLTPTFDETEIEYLPISGTPLTGSISVSGTNIAQLITSVTLETQTYNLESKEDKEKEIKNLKKRLKTERNYLTKIKIQKDITKLQNELKKQIKQDKKHSKTNKAS